MLGGYSNGYIMRVLYALPLCDPLRLSDGAPFVRGCVVAVALALSVRLSLSAFRLYG